jgi:hypothetical protein
LSGTDQSRLSGRQRKAAARSNAEARALAQKSARGAITGFNVFRNSSKPKMNGRNHKCSRVPFRIEPIVLPEGSSGLCSARFTAPYTAIQNAHGTSSERARVAGERTRSQLIRTSIIGESTMNTIKPV